MTNRPVSTKLDSRLIVDVQNAIEMPIDTSPPSDVLISQWASCAHAGLEPMPSKVSNEELSAVLAEVTVRLVDEAEMVELNQAYRGKTGSTNVLSFAVDDEFDFPEIPDSDGQSSDEILPQLLGDIVICHAVVEREAQQQNKSLLAHYAHMVTHGILHLHGYDHLDDPSAEQMEALEVNILSQSGFENPYT